MFIDNLFGTNLTLDWLWLYLQIGLLVGMVYLELTKKRKRNLYLIFISLTFLVLVQGQAYWMLDKIQSGEQQITHLLQIIDREGIRLANFYTGLTILTFIFTYITLSELDRKKNTKYPHKFQIHKIGKPPSMSAKIIIFAWVFSLTVILVNLLGGIEEAVYRPGKVVAGQTLIILLVSLGKLPLLHKLALNRKIYWIDIILFGLTWIAVLLNSRMLSTFLIIQLLFIANYFHKEISRKSLFLGFLSVLLILVIFGIYRDFANFRDTVQIDSIGKIIEFFQWRSEEGIIDWLYGLNIEGFAGLAGILTYEAKTGNLWHDFGLSIFAVFTQLIPNALRNDPNLPFAEMSNFLNSLYPYNGSIVSSGLENSYAHFGLLGLLGIGYSLGFLAHWLHKTIIRQQSDDLNLGLFSVYPLQVIRGSIMVTLFFWLGECFIYWTYKIILSNTRQTKKYFSNSKTMQR